MKLSTLEKFIQDENDVAQILNELDVGNTKRYDCDRTTDSF